MSSLSVLEQAKQHNSSRRLWDFFGTYAIPLQNYRELRFNILKSSCICGILVGIILSMLVLPLSNASQLTNMKHNLQITFKTIAAFFQGCFASLSSFFTND